MLILAVLKRSLVSVTLTGGHAVGTSNTVALNAAAILKLQALRGERLTCGVTAGLSTEILKGLGHFFRFFPVKCVAGIEFL